MKALISTPRLLLRPFLERDAASLSEVLSRSKGHLKGSVSIPDVPTDEAIGALSAEPLTFAIFDRAGVLLGCVGLEPTSDVTVLSLGYWLDVEATGRGIATEASRAFVNHAFADLGIAAVVIRCASSNRRSVAVAGRLGAREIDAPPDERRFLLEPRRLSWPQVVAVAASRFRVFDRRASSFQLAWRFAHGRTEVRQVVVAKLGDERGTPWLIVTAAVGVEGTLRSDEALKRNATLALGSLCIADGFLAVRFAAPLDRLQVGDVPKILETVGRQAAKLQVSTTESPMATVFDHYT